MTFLSILLKVLLTIVLTAIFILVIWEYDKEA
jgi:hypothetical protein